MVMDNTGTSITTGPTRPGILQPDTRPASRELLLERLNIKIGIKLSYGTYIQREPSEVVQQTTSAAIE
jgi:hypothetical protein